MSMKEVLVLGGGLSGLSAGYQLSKGGFKVRILEKNRTPGGLSRGFQVGNTWLDVYYRHIFASNRNFLNLVDELGLKEKLIWKKTKLGVFYENKIYELSPMNLLLDFQPLGLADKIKFGLSVLKILLKEDWKDLDNITTKEWVIENCGKRVYDVMFAPLLEEKWGDSAEKISAAWFWGRMKPRIQTRTSGMLSEKLGYMEGSFKTLIEKIVRKIKNLNGTIETSSEVKEISVKNNFVKRVVYKKDGKTKETKPDIVISTLPIPAFLKMFSDLDSSYKNKLEKIKYKSVVCSIIGMKKKLSDIYWLNVCSELPFGGVIEHTNFIEPKFYGNQNIVYLFNYTDTWNRKWKLSDKSLIEEYSTGLKEIFPSFSGDLINWFRVFRDAYATPVYERNYSKYMPDYRSPFENLYLTGIFLTYPLNRNMDTAIKAGNDVVRRILNDLW